MYSKPTNQAELFLRICSSGLPADLVELLLDSCTLLA
jgi:hypothetical protein